MGSSIHMYIPEQFPYITYIVYCTYVSVSKFPNLCVLWIHYYSLGNTVCREPDLEFKF